MKKLKFNLDSSKETLSKEQMRNVVGGSYGVCWVTTSGANYSNPSTGWIYVNSGSASSDANSWCVNQIATSGNGVYHCTYNCS